MAFQSAYIPYRAWWSSPFCRWQGSLASVHSVELAARVARRAFALRGLPVEALDGLVLGLTVHQKQSFYGAPWLASLIGAPGLAGPTVSQACATSARALATASYEVEVGGRECVAAICGDRTSNGPHVYYPNPQGPGGKGTAEDPVWDNFGADPNTGEAMLQTAEHVAREHGITREEQHETMLFRYEQYQAAIAGDRAFQRRYMVPAEVGKKLVEADEGVFPTTAEGLAKLRPVLEGGTVTYGAQTFPADGTAGLLVTTRERAQALVPNAPATVRVLGYGEARVAKARMPTAVVPAARRALQHAGIALGDISAFKTHNPFAINDIYFCRTLDIAPERVNRYGSPLIYGHPQAPTGLRAMIELIEELLERGGGRGLFSGCAAGDTAAAVVIEVS